MSRIALVAVASALVGAACVAEDVGAPTGISVDTLANGAIQVRNLDTGLWSADQAWSVEEVVRIGDASGDRPAYTFGDIRAVTFDPLGRIWVIESQANEIRIFDETGTHVRTTGREGQGPGEYLNPIGLTWDSEGRAWVADVRNSRYTVLDTAGTMIADHPRPVGGWGLPWRGRFTRDGSLWDVSFFPDPETEESATGILRMSVSEDVAAVDTVRVDRYEGGFFQVNFDEGYAVLRIPFTPQLSWLIDEHAGVWWGTGETYRIVRLASSGDTTTVVERAYTPLEVTAAERSDAIARFREDFDAEALDQIDFSRIPDVKPAYAWFIRDDSGYLWVRTSPTGSDEIPVFDVFDPRGYYLGPVTIPVGPWPRPVVVGDRVVGVVRDDLDVQHVVVFRILEREE